MSDSLSFRLSDDFVEGYRNKPVNWGWASGPNSLGEVTYRRTYSRDGEEWYQTVRRVVEGTYSILYDHCQHYSLPFDMVLARADAEKMFELIFEFKFTPPGRGLWMMGTDYIQKRGGAALNNPLDEETPILTREYGWVPIGEIEGEDVTVLTSVHDYGSGAEKLSKHHFASSSTWADARISESEVHPCRAISFEDGWGNQTSITASENHRWFRRRTSKTNWERVTTEALEVGDYVPIVKNPMWKKMSKVGQQHGFFFGDGTRANGELHQFSDSLPILRELFGETEVVDDGYHEVVRHLPLAWGSLPSGEYGKDDRYLYGFLSGYFAADGHVDKLGAPRLSSSRLEELEQVVELFRRLGVRCSDVHVAIPEGAPNNFSEYRNALYEIRLTALDLCEEFFLKENHKKRWSENLGSRRRDWARIVALEPVGERRVLCAEVPGYEQFVIDGFILTSNCGFTSTQNIDVEFDRPFRFLMDMSMLGVGIGFDTRGAGKLVWSPTSGNSVEVVIEDSREGWVDSMADVLRWGFGVGPKPVFDYGLVRPRGSKIRGFGGVAEGADPLILLHKRLFELIDRRCENKVSSTDIVDIANMIGVCVVSGNVRRSAEIAFGSVDDDAYALLKDYKTNPDRESWGYVSNNSVFVSPGDDYSKFTKRIIDNGEPGFMWLENAQAYSRMAGPRDWKDHRVLGANPCSFAGETIVHTTAGPRTIASLENEPFWALINGEAFYSPSGAWVTGEDDIYTLTTKQGYEVGVTANHKIMTASGEWVEAQDLKPGDEIQIHNHREVPHWDGPGSEEEGYLLGLMMGDGGFEAKTAVIKVWHKDEGYQGIKDEGLRCAEATLTPRSDWLGWKDHGRGYEIMTINSRVPGSSELWFEKFGISKPKGKSVTQEIEQASSSFQSAYLRGFFDADGHIEGWKEEDSQGVSVRLGQSNLGDLKAVQRMLLRLGIKSRIYVGSEEETSVLPDGKGGVKEYPTKKSWRLVVSSDDVAVFAERVGFTHTLKREKLEKALVVHSFYSKPYVATVESLKFLRRDYVWDLSVSTKKAFDANGFYVSNSEQSLEDKELCCLVETYPQNCDTFDEYAAVLKAAFIYAKAVTLLPTHWPETNAVMLRNRRIGTSMSGIAQYIAHRSEREFVQWCDEGYEVVSHYDSVYSEWLCVRESIKKTSIKPSGTVSLLSGSTPGLHFPTYRHYIRRIRFAEGHPDVEPIKAAGYHVEPAINEASTVIVEFPVKGDPKVPTEREVSIAEKIRITALLQEVWADNQVSSTVTFDPQAEGHLIPDLLRAYDRRLKSISFLPYMEQSSHVQAPYEAITAEEYEQMTENLKPIEWPKSVHDQNDEFCDGAACAIPAAVSGGAV